MSAKFQIQCHRGSAVLPFLPALAHLRMQVFAEWPYLYQGDLAYEQHYLQTYAKSQNSVFALAYVGTALVGCATGVPLIDETADCQAPFVAEALALTSVFYFGESVLLPAYRGLGIGHAFFDAREQAARATPGISLCAFCAVVRDKDDPRQPAGVRSLEAFWLARGYQKSPTLHASFRWREIGEREESEKQMAFWIRRL
jgi:GNAT superfamily N-acetyltransferase